MNDCAIYVLHASCLYLHAKLLALSEPFVILLFLTLLSAESGELFISLRHYSTTNPSPLHRTTSSSAWSQGNAIHSYGFMYKYIYLYVLFHNVFWRRASPAARRRGFSIKFIYAEKHSIKESLFCFWECPLSCSVPYSACEWSAKA